jgi:hypothetical protein
MTDQPVDAQTPEAPLKNRPQGYYVPRTRKPAGFGLRKRAPEAPGQPLEKSYDLLDKFEYVDKDGRSYTIPASGKLHTDLASIPGFASWLVPKDGRHTQAALVHDAMIVNRAKKELPDFESSPPGIVVDDAEADAIFRRGMKVSGVPPVRRWMIWAAVAVRTCLLFGTWRQRIGLVVIGVAFGLFGLFALPDVLDLPHYGSLTSDLALVAAGAALVAGSLVWRRRRQLIVSLVATAATAGVLWVGISQLPGDIPANVPSVLPSFSPPDNASLPRPEEDSTNPKVAAKEAKARTQVLDWYRYTNEDPFFLQLAVFMGVLAAGACVTAVLLWPRYLLGLSFPVLLGLLAFPVYFVLVATGVYWVVEGPWVGWKWWQERNR